MVKQEKTSLTLGYYGNSVEIMKDLVSQFGGWIDENDCDDQSYYPILTNKDKVVQPVKKIVETRDGVLIDKKALIEALENWCGKQRYLIPEEVWDIIQAAPVVDDKE